MPAPKIGERHGRFTVVAHRTITLRAVLLVCDCGRTKTVLVSNLPRTNSCGCLNAEKASARGKTHGLSNTRVYWAWAEMIRRCHNPKSDNYTNYGGRGITVCARWRESFLNFIDDMGGRPDGMSLERINNDGNYEPGNCRWASARDQAANRRNTITVLLDGQRMVLEEAARRLGAQSGSLSKWAKSRGLPIQDAVDWYARHERGSNRPRSTASKEVIIHGIRMSLTEASAILGVKRHTLVARVHKDGITHQEAVNWYLSRLGNLANAPPAGNA